jgi:peptidyl-prolyl cis-trans isomerase C
VIRKLAPVLAALLSGGVIAAVLVAPSRGGSTPTPAAAQTAAPTGQPAPKPGSGLSPAADASGSDAVVAKVGSSVITAGELEQRIAETPRATLAKLGSTPEEIRRGFLEQVLIRDAILAEEAKAQGLDKKKDVRDRVLAVYRSALIEVIKTEKGQVTEDDIKAYYDANKQKFSAPKRIGIHRILVASEDDAKEILAELGNGGAPDQKKWNDLAREKSLDKSTHLRGGNLGILNEDGSTTQHDQHYDPALFQAADKVKDGELVPQPVKEGGKFAIVWKRQSMRAMSRPLELEAPGIRAALVDQRIREGVAALLQALRPAHLKELNPELTDMVSVNAQGDVEKAKRPGVLPRSKRAATPVPIEGPGGLR